MWTNIIIAAATAAVAGTAIQSLIRERRRDKERRRAVDARISAIAYALRRQIESWYPEGTWPGKDREKKRKAKDLVRHFDEAEERVERLLSLAPEGSANNAEAIRMAVVRFYRATKFINETASASLSSSGYNARTGEVTEVSLSREVGERFDEAFNLLLRCVEYLEEVIEDPLLDAAANLPE